MDPEDANYQCKLTPESLEKAKKELNEDPKQRLSSVQTLRKWIREQSQFVCRTDTMFLLAILRRAKFSQLIARELITNMLTMKTKYPEVMANLDLNEPQFNAMLDSGSAVYCPKRDREGRSIVIIRPGMVPNLSDPLFSYKSEMRMALAMGELRRQMDENVSVNGSILVFDFTNTTMKHLNRQSSEERKMGSKIWQDCTPERVKAFLFYNAGPILELILTTIKQFMKKKNQERIQTHETMESLYNVVPMEYWPDEYLPDDYKGPSAGSVSEIAAYWKKIIADPANRKLVLECTSDKYKINETKSTQQSKKPLFKNEEIPQASFRKLNID